MLFNAHIWAVKRVKGVFMRIYKIAKHVEVYHGSNQMFSDFDYDKTAQGVFWFTSDLDKIKRGDVGAGTIKYIAKVILDVNNTAGWSEYDKLGLGQIESKGFDSILLDDDWVIFDKNNIQIVEWIEN